LSSSIVILVIAPTLCVPAKRFCIFATLPWLGEVGFASFVFGLDFLGDLTLDFDSVIFDWVDSFKLHTYKIV